MTNRSEIDVIYAEAVALADGARAWFDGPGRDWRAALSTDEQAQVAIESLAVTARLLAIISWTLDPGARDTATAAPFRIEAPPPLPPALAPTRGGEIAARSRLLAGRVATLSAPARPVLSASYEAVWRA